MTNKYVIVLDIVATLLTGIWIIRGVVLGLSTADLIFNYIYSTVVFIALILTLLEETG